MQHGWEEVKEIFLTQRRILTLIDLARIFRPCDVKLKTTLFCVALLASVMPT